MKTRSVSIVVLSIVLSTVLAVPGVSAKRFIEPHTGRHTVSRQTTISPQLPEPVVSPVLNNSQLPVVNSVVQDPVVVNPIATSPQPPVTNPILQDPVVVNPLPSDPQRPVVLVPGDVNSDGRVSLADYVLLRRAFQNGTVRSYGSQADTYKDTYYTTRDLDVLRQYLLGSIRTLPMVPGDVTDNGVVDVADAVKALRFYEELETPTTAQFMATDIEVDEYIERADVDRILEIAVGLTTGPLYLDPSMYCAVSGLQVGEDEGMAIMCNLAARTTVFYGEELLCTLSGADGGLDVDPNDNNSTTTSVIMEAVSAQTRGAGVGWQWCEYESEDTIATDNSVQIEVTNTDVNHRMFGLNRMTFTASDDAETTVFTLGENPLGNETDLYPSSRGTSVMVIAYDNNYNGVEGLAVAGTVPSDTGLVRTNPDTLENLRIIRPMTELADGAYFFDVEPTIIDGMGSVEIELYDASSILKYDAVQPFNIINTR